jgi:hypothetical protein
MTNVTEVSMTDLVKSKIEALVTKWDMTMNIG